MGLSEKKTKYFSSFQSTVFSGQVGKSTGPLDIVFCCPWFDSWSSLLFPLFYNQIIDTF